jgi:glycosyltransferase involved in cell wall biosynthesis
VQLYRDADIVVVSLLENKSTSGITTLLEAMSCRRPVVVTKTQGLACYLDTPGTVTVVNPGDPDGLRQAIVNLLNHPEVAEAQAERGYRLALKHYNSEQYIENIASQLSGI